MEVCRKSKQEWEPTGRPNASLLHSATAPAGALFCTFRIQSFQIQKPEFCLTKQSIEGKPPLGQATTWVPNVEGNSIWTRIFFLHALTKCQLQHSSSFSTWSQMFSNQCSFSIKVLGKIAIEPVHLVKPAFGARVNNASCVFNAKKEIRCFQGRI